MRSLLKVAKEKENTDILADILDHGAIETVCRAIIEHSARPQLCITYIRFAGDILQEEDPEIQDEFLEFMKADKNNAFIIGYDNFLKVEYQRLKNSEQLRRDLDRA